MVDPYFLAHRAYPCACPAPGARAGRLPDHSTSTATGTAKAETGNGAKWLAQNNGLFSGSLLTLQGKTSSVSRLSRSRADIQRTVP
eukprot:3003795-Prymnesium_polylepis.1